MRLIDADEIRYTSLQDGFGRIKECIAFSTDIDKTPTVEAIPIDWMKKFANERAKNEEEEGYWHFWGTDLLQMITQWEKENGK